MERADVLAKVEVFHSQIADEKQKEITKSLMTAGGRVRIAIATSALSMGLDTSGIYHCFLSLFRH